MDRHFGHYVRILHWCTDQRMTSALTDVELTASQGPILGYIAHRKTAPCSRDIEEEFRLTHPTVSGILSRLEKKVITAIMHHKQDVVATDFQNAVVGQQVKLLHTVAFKGGFLGGKADDGG